MTRTPNYVPHEGYGGLTFGMAPARVEAFLGAPGSVERDEDTLDLGMFDPDELSLIKDHQTWLYEGSVAGHAFVSVRFAHGKLVEIDVHDDALNIPYGPHNPLSAQRKPLMAALAKAEEQTYNNGRDWFFPNAGIVMTDPKFWKTKGTVSFVHVPHIMERLDFADWYETDFDG